jgi:hypothetical protein
MKPSQKWNGIFPIMEHLSLSRSDGLHSQFNTVQPLIIAIHFVARGVHNEWHQPKQTYE